MTDAIAHRRRLQRLARLCGLALLAATAGVAAQVQPPVPPIATTPTAESGSGFDVLHYAARLAPDIDHQTLTGTVALHARALVNGLHAFELDAGALTVDVVRVAGQSLQHKRAGARLVIALPRPSAAGERWIFDIAYHGAPKFGLEFPPKRSQLYTIFSTSQWLVTVDAPAERATLDLSVVLPRGWSAVGNGRLVSHRALGDGTDLYRWRQSVPVPSYTYGFAAGRFVEASDRRGRVTLRYLAEGYSADELRRVFADSGDMLAFFEQRAGVRYPGQHYTQALVAKTIGQELAGFALMSETYGREVLTDPQAEALIAHEVAHQWWGNGVTCANWNHFWLNEGFANFMTAAYLQHRFGEAAYQKRIGGWRERVERLQAEGKDRPLVYPDWNQPSGDDRAVVYQKGAYVLHLLREHLGERVFWRGMRAYTRKHFGRAVVTTDFQAAMERASGRSLAAFFQQWVYAAPSDGNSTATSAHSLRSLPARAQ